jgi:hypothetical protein
MVQLLPCWIKMSIRELNWHMAQGQRFGEKRRKQKAREADRMAWTEVNV